MDKVCHAVRSVVPMADYRLLLAFDAGERRIFDMKPYLEKGIFAALRDLPLFHSVRVGFDTIEWGNGADICPEVLYDRSTPVNNEALPTRTAS